jgi:hypothetical protein
MFKTVGGDAIDAASGISVPTYAFLLNGWRIKPQEAHHTLSVKDGILLVEGGGDPFINPTGNFVVRINYSQPVQAITVSTGSGSGGTATVDYQQISDAIWNAPLSSYSNSDTFGRLLKDQGTNVMKILGLVHQNILIDETVYDNKNNLIGSRIRIWEKAEDVGTQVPPLATYSVDVETAGPGKFTSWKQVEV